MKALDSGMAELNAHGGGEKMSALSPPRFKHQPAENCQEGRSCARSAVASLRPGSEAGHDGLGKQVAAGVADAHHVAVADAASPWQAPNQAPEDLRSVSPATSGSGGHEARLPVLGDVDRTDEREALVSHGQHFTDGLERHGCCCAEKA